MADTINTMELIHADNINADQVMIDDLIKIGDDIVEVIAIESDANGNIYSIEHQNEFGEKEVVEFNYNDVIKLYVFIEHDA